MRIMTVGNSCTLPGLPSNDYLSCMQHDEPHRFVSLTILLLMKSIKKVYPLLYISLLTSTTFYIQSGSAWLHDHNKRTGLGYLKTWQKCDTDKLNDAMDDIASMWGNSWLIITVRECRLWRA